MGDGVPLCPREAQDSAKPLGALPAAPRPALPVKKRSWWRAGSHQHPELADRSAWSYRTLGGPPQPHAAHCPQRTTRTLPRVTELLQGQPWVSPCPGTPNCPGWPCTPGNFCSRSRRSCRHLILPFIARRADVGGPRTGSSAQCRAPASAPAAGSHRQGQTPDPRCARRDRAGGAQRVPPAG